MKNNTQFKRLNINLPADLDKRVREYGEKLGLNATSAYIVLLNQALDQNTSINNLPLLLELMETLKENGAKLDSK